MIRFRCVKCGAEHPRELLDEWGSNGNGDGCGPTPCCTEVIERNGSGSLCKGQLIAEAIADEPTPTPEN